MEHASCSKDLKDFLRAESQLAYCRHCRDSTEQRKPAGIRVFTCLKCGREQPPPEAEMANPLDAAPVVELQTEMMADAV
jgi:hypothetical protein